MNPIRTKSRFGWGRPVTRKGEPRRRRFSLEQLHQAVEAMQLRGWATVMEEIGRPHEKVPFVHRTDPRCQLVLKYRSGERRFEVGLVEKVLGEPVTTLRAARRLAQVGLAMVECDGERLRLEAANPDLASLINRVRCRGEVVHEDVARVAGLVLGHNSADSRMSRLTEDIRTMAFDKWLNDWDIRVDGMSWSHGKVTLVSEWHFDRNGKTRRCRNGTK